MIKAVIFDFDGVLAESVDIKTEAFGELFRNFPDKVKEIVKFHVDNGGMSRFDKFRFIYADILKEPLSRDEFDRLCTGFSGLVVEKVVAAPFVKGALEFLRKNSQKYDMFVVSGTPENEIKDIIAKRDMNGYFSEVCGSPEPKERHLARILEENGYARDEVIFLGDSINDYRAARKTRVQFAFRTSHGKDPEFSEGIATKFTDLFEFAEYLKRSNA